MSDYKLQKYLAKINKLDKNDPKFDVYLQKINQYGGAWSVQQFLTNIKNKFVGKSKTKNITTPYTQQPYTKEQIEQYNQILQLKQRTELAEQELAGKQRRLKSLEIQVPDESRYESEVKIFDIIKKTLPTYLEKTQDIHLYGYANAPNFTYNSKINLKNNTLHIDIIQKTITYNDSYVIGITAQLYTQIREFVKFLTELQYLPFRNMINYTLDTYYTELYLFYIILHRPVVEQIHINRHEFAIQIQMELCHISRKEYDYKTMYKNIFFLYILKKNKEMQPHIPIRYIIQEYIYKYYCTTLTDSLKNNTCKFSNITPENIYLNATKIEKFIYEQLNWNMYLINICGIHNDLMHYCINIYKHNAFATETQKDKTIYLLIDWILTSLKSAEEIKAPATFVISEIIYDYII